MKTAPAFERVGHRGAPRRRRENTLESFQEAVALKADAVELDVHETSDGIMVVHHDPRLRRDVQPQMYRGAALATLRAAEVASVRLAGGEQIPTLDQVLVDISPKAFVYVELKGGSPKALAPVIADYALRVAVHSFDHALIGEMSEIAPGIPRGILLDDSVGDVAKAMAAVRARDVWPAARLVNKELMRQVKSAGGRVIPWTVNSRAEAVRLIALGVDGICTDELEILPPS
jgi:glycerophosphoryl diester phosphodiesterase